MALFTRLNGHTSVKGPMYFVFWLDRCLYISDFQSHQVKANSEVVRSCVSLTMTDTEVSTKLLTIFEALISSCSQQYQLLCEEDQLKANKILKKTFITCFEIKSEDPVKEEEKEYFEQDDGVVSELKVKDQLEMTLNVGNSETQELDDAEIFQELDFNCPDTDSSSENEQKTKQKD